MLNCIRCGLCLSVCPTYQETMREEEGPRGRIAAARAWTEGNLALTSGMVAHQLSCLLCEACTAICPAGVRMEELGVAVRAAMEQESRRSPWEALVRFAALRLLFPRMWLFRTLVSVLAWYQSFGAQRLVRASRLLWLLRLAGAESLLPPISRPFVVPKDQVAEPRGPERARVGLLAGCVMSTAFAEVDRATVRVLQANGCAVHIPSGQGCCGALHAHSGDRDGAIELAKQTIAAFERAPVDYVVNNAAGCGAMLKEYGHLLRSDPAWAERAAAFTVRCKDVLELLDELGLVPPDRALPIRVTYQEPCHLAPAQRVSAAPRRLLRQVPGLEFVELTEAAFCCGSAGVYNVVQPHMADRLLKRKIGHVLATGADCVASANPGCMLQVQAGLASVKSTIRVRHVIDLLDESYGRSDV